MKRMKITNKDIFNAINILANKLKDQKPQAILAIARGGLIPAYLLSEALGIRRMYTIGIEYYSDVGKTIKVPYVYQDLSEDFEVDNVCIVDDIVDTGNSISVAVERAVQHKAKEIITCSIFYKPKSKIKPNFYYKEVPNDVWLDFYWEKGYGKSNIQS